MEFETVAAPTKSRAGRKPLPNPFKDQGVFPTAEGEARSILVPEGRDSTRARRLIRQARQAAKEMGLSARVQINEEVEGGTVQLLFWTVEKIERKARA